MVSLFCCSYLTSVNFSNIADEVDRMTCTIDLWVDVNINKHELLLSVVSTSKPPHCFHIIS